MYLCNGLKMENVPEQFGMVLKASIYQWLWIGLKAVKQEWTVLALRMVLVAPRFGGGIAIEGIEGCLGDRFGSPSRHLGMQTLLPL
jgi:phosphodiesterase/alkaline phosphatase D-like protein